MFYFEQVHSMNHKIRIQPRAIFDTKTFDERFFTTLYFPSFLLPCRLFPLADPLGKVSPFVAFRLVYHAQCPLACSSMGQLQFSPRRFFVGVFCIKKRTLNAFPLP